MLLFHLPLHVALSADKDPVLLGGCTAIQLAKMGRSDVVALLKKEAGERLKVKLEGPIKVPKGLQGNMRLRLRFIAERKKQHKKNNEALNKIADAIIDACGEQESSQTLVQFDRSHRSSTRQEKQWVLPAKKLNVAKLILETIRYLRESTLDISYESLLARTEKTQKLEMKASLMKEITTMVEGFGLGGNNDRKRGGKV